MKKLFYSLALVSGFIHTGQSQAQEIAFYKKYGPVAEDFGHGIQESADGNLLMLSNYRRMHTNGENWRDIRLIKINSDGDTVWRRNIEDENASELARAIGILPDGKIIIAGYAVAEGLNAILICLDENGSLLWKKEYTSSNNFIGFTGMKIEDNGIVLCGITQKGDDVNDIDGLILKTDLDGNELWRNRMGDESPDELFSIISTSDKGYMMAGLTETASGTDAWLAKTDSAGNISWYKSYGTPGVDDRSTSIVSSFNSTGEEDGYIFTGIKNSADLAGDVFLVKVDPDGTVIWDKSIEGPVSFLFMEGTDIINTGGGGYALTAYGAYEEETSGRLLQYLYFAELDENGEIISEVEEKNSAELFVSGRLCQASDGTFYLTGMVVEDLSAARQAYIIKITSDPSNIPDAENIHARLLHVFPNPAKDVLNIHHKGADPIREVILFGLDGRLLNTYSVKDTREISIAVTMYSGNTIIVQTYTRDGKSDSRMVVIQ